MSSYISIPELALEGVAGGSLRLPPGNDVRLTPRVRRLIDTPSMRRLANIKQLGPVHLVYPGATHSRWEHSLGVFGVATNFLQQLRGEANFTERVTSEEAELFLLAALVHDIGHWPFCHAIEDIDLPHVPRHESLAESWLNEPDVRQLLATDWGTRPDEVLDLLVGKGGEKGRRLLRSMLSSPIDVDKIDYLTRDSYHAGVPYGRNFDQSRLIASLCVNEPGDGLAIDFKGKTAAEMMIFSRYVMFSEVYWHHAVRSATAMLQRAVYSLADELEWKTIFTAADCRMLDHLASSAHGLTVERLVNGIAGGNRQLYKRLAQYSLCESPELYVRLAQRPYGWLVDRSQRLADLLQGVLGEPVDAEDVLFDAPPVALEVQCNVSVRLGDSGLGDQQFRGLSQISPVVRALAEKQFDDYVKRVRIFVHPRLIEKAKAYAEMPKLIEEAIS